MTDYRQSHLAKGAIYDAAIAAAPFDAYLDGHERRIVLEVTKRLFPNGLGRYADFACGTGRITATVAPLARESYGIDVSPSMIAEARRKCPATTFLVADLTRCDGGIEPADLVTAFRFFGNAQPELRASALRAIASLVRPGGYLIVNNHRNPRSIHNVLLRANGTAIDVDLAYDRLNRLLQESGFRITEAHAIGVWVVAYRLRRQRTLRGPAARWLERLSRLPFVSRIAPDAVIVARRTSVRP